MKNKKILLGAVLAVFLLGVFSFVTMQLKDAYALKEGSGSFEGFTNLQIPQGQVVKKGEKVKVDLFFDDTMWENILVYLTNEAENESITAYLKDIHTGNTNDRYFVMPKTAKAGETYILKQITLYGYNQDKIDIYDAFQGGANPYMNPGDNNSVTVSSEDTDTDDYQNDFKINNFKLKTTEASIDDKIYLDINYSGEKPLFIGVWLDLVEYGNSIYYTIEDLDSNPYIQLNNDYGQNVISGDYHIAALSVGFDNDFIYYANKEVYKNISEDDTEWKWFTLPETVKINGDKNATIDQVNDFADIISVSTQEASINDRIDVELKNIDNTKVESVLIMYDGLRIEGAEYPGSTINAYVKSLDSNPYFIVPFNARKGDYVLKSVIIKYTDGTKKYYRLGSENPAEKLAYIVLKVKNDNGTLIEKDKAEFNNLDYNSRMLASLEELDEDAIITVNATGNPFIDKGLFDVIRETRRTLIIEYFDSEWVFSGTDIVNPKSIDVSMGYETITDKNINNNDMLNDLDKVSLMLTFTNNGDLPGKALIRLKANQIDEMFEGDSLYIYYYNDQDSLDPVAMEVQKDNGYYDFYIDHNSKYILTNKKLSGSYVTSNDRFLKLNTKNTTGTKEKNNNTQTLLIIGGIIIVLLLIIIIILLTKKNNNPKNKKTKK